jgi:glycosyltransferase involved in cell wall biosynthesis
VKLQTKSRILHVTPFYPPSIGGISRCVFNICRDLNEFNLDVHIVTSKNIIDHNTHDLRKSDKIIEISSIHFPGWPYSTLRNFSFPVDLGFRLDSIIKHGSFDVVHVHGHHYPISWIALRSARKNHIPTVLSLHGTYALNPKNLGGKSKIEDLFNKYFFRKILQNSNFVIGGTNQIVEYAKKYSTPSTNFKTIPTGGVDSSKYVTNLQRKNEYRKKYDLNPSKIVVLFVGRFDDSKGALNFAKAAELLLRRHNNKFEVIMVGQGSLEQKIRSVVAGIKGIQILKWQPAETIHEIYIAADLFILPSKFEALPLTIMEAMSACLYILYSNVGGVDDILQGYPKRKILQNITPEEINHTCLKLYDDRFPTFNKGETNRKLNFDWRNIAHNIKSVYDEISQSKFEN